ncbi:GAF domain-containing protein [Promicromonospora sp. NPDC023805]|uniref:GAF domain-containing protein n=1 Tax=Promicromonospora sp. NPDC023805 TaxID=3154696 RepID=UPI0033CF8F81
MDPTQLLASFARSLAKADIERPLSMRLCEACVDTFRAQGGALTLSTASGERVAVSTPGVFEELEPLQKILGEGPVQRAMAEDRLVVMHIDGADEYSVFSQLAESAGGAVTLYAVPMRAGGGVVGAFSLYVTADPEGRSAQDLQFIADAVAASLYEDGGGPDWTEDDQLNQAIGMVAAQLWVSPDDALVVIRAHAFSRSTSLLSVVADVHDRRLVFSHEE